MVKERSITAIWLDDFLVSNGYFEKSRKRVSKLRNAIRFIRMTKKIISCKHITNYEKYACLKVLWDYTHPQDANIDMRYPIENLERFLTR